jgi:hypothetical protein
MFRFNVVKDNEIIATEQHASLMKKLMFEGLNDILEGFADKYSFIDSENVAGCIAEIYRENDEIITRVYEKDLFKNLF